MVLTRLRHWLLAIAASSAALLALPSQASTMTITRTLDVTGIASNDVLGSADNVSFQWNIGAGSRLVGIGWNVSLFADSPSWLSEVSLYLSNGSGSFVDVAPGGNANRQSGDGNFSDIIDLVAEGLDFAVGEDGLLSFEFFDLYDDFAGEWDAIWTSGLLTLQIEVIPEPGSQMLVALALLGMLAVMQRRRSQR